MKAPSSLLIVTRGIPLALRAQRHWAVWRYEVREGKPTKVPHQPSGARAKANDPATWVSFAEALAAYNTGTYDGLLFALWDGWAALDFDDCVANLSTIVQA